MGQNQTNLEEIRPHMTKWDEMGQNETERDKMEPIEEK